MRQIYTSLAVKWFPRRKFEPSNVAHPALFVVDSISILFFMLFQSASINSSYHCSEILINQYPMCKLRGLLFICLDEMFDTHEWWTRFYYRKISKDNRIHRTIVFITSVVWQKFKKKKNHKHTLCIWMVFESICLWINSPTRYINSTVFN